MKTTLHLSFALIILINTSIAQTYEWFRPVDVDYSFNPEMINYTLAVDHEENAILFGIKEHIEFYTTSFGKLRIIKYDASGIKIWENEIDGLAMAMGSTCDIYGNIYITGKHRSVINFWGEDSIAFDNSSYNSFIAKVNNAGGLEWAMNLSDIYPEASDINDITTDGNGNLLLAISGWPDSYITKLSPEGNILLDIPHTNVGSLTGLDIHTTGEIAVTGTCANQVSLFGGTAVTSPFGYNIYLAYYSSIGDLQYVHFAEDVTCNSPKVKFDADGNIFWNGPLHMPSIFGGLQSGGPSWVYDFFLVKVKPGGYFEWLLEVPEGLSGDALTGKISPLDVSSDGKIILGGFTRGSIDWGNNVLSSAELYYSTLVLEVDNEGTAQWAKTAGGDFYDNIHSLKITSQGNIYIAGIAGDTVNFDTITHQSEDSFYPFIAKIDYNNITSIDNPLSDDKNLSIYPNPARDHITLDTKELIGIKIFSSDGTLVLEKKLSQSTHIDVSSLSAGLYMVSGVTESGDRLNERFLKQ